MPPANNTDVAAPALPTSIEQDDFNVSRREGRGLTCWSPTPRGSDSLESVQKAELLTGSVSEYTETENVYINGTKYSYNKVLGTNEKSEQYTITRMPPWCWMPTATSSMWTSHLHLQLRVHPGRGRCHRPEEEGCGRRPTSPTASLTRSTSPSTWTPTALPTPAANICPILATSTAGTPS